MINISLKIEKQDLFELCVKKVVLFKNENNNVDLGIVDVNQNISFWKEVDGKSFSLYIFGGPQKGKYKNCIIDEINQRPNDIIVCLVALKE